MAIDIQHLLSEVQHCMLCDQARLRQQLGKYRKSASADLHRDEKLQQLHKAITASAARRQHRETNLPTVTYPEDLPISLRRDDIGRAIREHQVVIVAGETGSGKTTQLPKICLSIGRGLSGMIGHTQPRRIAARSVATRIAEELACPLGDAVGYKVRFSDRSHPDSYIKLMTDGILLAELQTDRYLNQYDTLIIDEAHERSLNIDFLLGYVKKLLPKRPDLKLIITSATIDTERFAKHFNHAPVIEVSGRSYPVEIRYQPLEADDEQDADMISGILSAVDELARQDKRGDILIFLSGEREIRDVAEALRKHHPVQSEILPLYSRLSTSEQNRIFQVSRLRRIVLSTNVAETSLTVPGIRYVIDPGMARISHYSYRSKVQRLPIEKVSQSSAAQRAGRCGRVSAGVCIRLYAEEDFQARPEFTAPEIQRTNLASVILQMRVLGLGNPEEFPFIDPPDSRYVNDGFRLLHELGAMDEHRQLTPIGKNLARLPVDPKIGRMVLAAKDFDCLNEVLAIASGLSIQDPRERPADKQQKADQQHTVFRDEDSDFLSLLNLWREFQKQQKRLSHNQLRKYCRNHFLSYLRMKEWKETFQQLRAQVKNMGMTLNQRNAEYPDIHRALLSGLLGNIGLRDDSEGSSRAGKKAVNKPQRYQGVRNTEYFIFPGSSLVKKTPRWLMSAELVETSRLYARGNSRIEPEWIEPAALHLLKRSYTEAYWDERRGRVSVFETVTLYGLILAARRRVDFSAVNPEVSREIFIREALVKSRLRTRGEFYRHNQALINQVLMVEDKIRRRDVFAEEESLYQFFAALIPEHVCSTASFERWREKAEKKNPHILELQQQDVTAKLVSTSENDYPGEFFAYGVVLPLAYCFDPGGNEDGVTATVPLGALNQLATEAFEWLVPGFLEEKLMAILKGLPKSIRKQLVPVPNSARLLMEKLLSHDAFSTSGLFELISIVLKQEWGFTVSSRDLRAITLPDHLRLRFLVIAQGNKELGASRDLEQLQHHWGDKQTNDTCLSVKGEQWPKKGIHAWDFPDIPESIEVEHDGGRFKVFPALVDHGDSVGVELLDSQHSAVSSHAKGLRRLVRITLAKEIKYLRRNLSGIETMCLQYSGLGSCEELKNDIVDAAVDRCFYSDNTDIRSRKAFNLRLSQNRNALAGVSYEISECLGMILKQYYALRKVLLNNNNGIPKEVCKDIETQLEGLVFEGFVVKTPNQWLLHLPRFLNGIDMRLQKLSSDFRSDEPRLARLTPLLATYADLSKQKKVNRDALENLRWMLEEYRVSLFAQQLKTSMPISQQRIDNQIALCIE